MDSVSDKDREVPLDTDGQWHQFIFLDDGKLVDHMLLPKGTYLVQYQLLGWVYEEPTTRMDVRIQRYHDIPGDNGTAWDYIDFDKRNGKTWFGTRFGKVYIDDDILGFGIEYRVKGGKVSCSQRILKPMKVG